MTGASRTAKTVALVTAVSLHCTLALVFVGDDAVEMEGQAGAISARIGSSFADLAVGRIDAHEVTDQAEPVEATAVQTPQSAQPQRPSPVKAQTAQAVVAPPAKRAQIDPPVSVEASKPVLPATEAPKAQTPVDPVMTAQAAPKTQTPPELDSAPPDHLVGKKPKHRPEKPVEPPTKQAAKAPAKPAPKGNAQTNARAGQVTGNQTAKATTSGAGGSSDQSGNAAVSNYPGKVMRKLSRVPRPRVRARGSAMVSFKIAANGGLSGVSIARSSGSAELDRAALQVVRRASPFPPPPAGARKSFSIEIKGR